MAEKPADEQLLKRFAAGQRAALGELARRYERPLLGLAAGLLGPDRDAACDAVQETWLRVIRHAASFDGRSGVKTWLCRILINRCHDARARRNKNAGRELSQASERVAATTGGASDGLIEEQSSAVRRAVESLDDDRRFVILLCYHADMTHAQAAEILEIPLGTLKSRLNAALTSLREKLAAEAKP